MSSSIRISDDTKKKLEARKREGESFDELLDRLARTEKDVEEMAGWMDEDEVQEMKEHLDETKDELNESLGKNDARRE
jgi:predicted CopG family antitoxin